MSRGKCFSVSSEPYGTEHRTVPRQSHLLEHPETTLAKKATCEAKMTKDFHTQGGHRVCTVYHTAVLIPQASPRFELLVTGC